MLMLQQPSFFVAAQVANSVTAKPWDQPSGVVSIGTLVLGGTTLLSLLQWWLVAYLARCIQGWMRGRSPILNRSV
jgi:hypothetical protein